MPFDIHPLVALAIYVGGLVAAIIAFGVQIRILKQAQLQNTKLVLDIQELSVNAAKREEKLTLELEDLRINAAKRAEKLDLELESMRHELSQKNREAQISSAGIVTTDLINMRSELNGIYPLDDPFAICPSIVDPSPLSSENSFTFPPQLSRVLIEGDLIEKIKELDKLVSDYKNVLRSAEPEN